MDIDDGRDAWEWYQHLSREDKATVNKAMKVKETTDDSSKNNAKS